MCRLKGVTSTEAIETIKSLNMNNIYVEDDFVKATEGVIELAKQAEALKK